MPNAIPEHIANDPRARFVDLDQLHLGELPPFEQWTDDDWMDAIHDAPAPIAPGEPHADFRLLQVDFRELDVDQYPPIAEWSDVEYDRAVRDTRAAQAERGGPLPSENYREESVDLRTVPIERRLCLIDFSLLALDHLPPLGDWHAEHWWEAIMVTYSDWMSLRIENGEEEMVSLEEAFAGRLAQTD